MPNYASYAFRIFALLVAAALASRGVAAQGITGNKQGQGGSAVQGAAGTQGSDRSQRPRALRQADGSRGRRRTPRSDSAGSLRSYNLQSPSGLIRMMIQQSNCFIVVERGVGMQNAMQERALARAVNCGRTRMLAAVRWSTADFILTPSVVFSENNAGGVGASGAGGLLGVGPRRLRGRRRIEIQRSADEHAARRRSKHACRSRQRKAAPVRPTWLSAAVCSVVAGAAPCGGYGNTNEGKIIAAAFLDNYNQIVGVVRGDPSLQRSVGTLAQEAAAGGQTKAGAAFAEGDVLLPKIANVKLLSGPKDEAKPVATLGRGDELAVIGGVENGFVNVQGANGAGWVKVVLVNKQ